MFTAFSFTAFSHSPLACMFGAFFLFSLSSPACTYMFAACFWHYTCPFACMFAVCFLLSHSVHGLTPHMHTCMHVWSLFFSFTWVHVSFFSPSHVLTPAVTPLLFSSFFRFLSFIQYDDYLLLIIFTIMIHLFTIHFFFI